jgi:magnesium-protoporphyrin O-methyltransferase
MRRGELETYFDRTAVDAWSRLTSDAPVGRIRATVRAGRDRMRATLLGWLPADLSGTRLLDAGCGTGTLAVAAAARGADVVAIDLSPTLIRLARERYPNPGGGRIDFRVGDLLDPALGEFDFVIAMDSLIHYAATDIVGILATLTTRTRTAISCTFAPRTPALAIMHSFGRWFPRTDRAPALVPIPLSTIEHLVTAEPALADWQPARTERINQGFYISQALELRKA